jgi:hypothetical protein
MTTRTNTLAWPLRAMIALCMLTPAYVPTTLCTDNTYTQSGGVASRTNQTYTASSTNTSGVLVSSSGVLTLANSSVTTSGNTTSADSSSFYGLDAGVLARSKSNITLTGCKIVTSGTGANGVFSTGTGTSVTLVQDTIVCTGRLGHGVDATMGGVMSLTDVVIATGTGANSAAIATDRGGGTITVLRGSATTTGNDAPGIYSTGIITVTDAVVSASASEAVVIEGTNSVALNNTEISAASSGMSDKWGTLIYQSMSGDAQGDSGSFAMTGGSLTYTGTSGPLFFITNTRAKIMLSHAIIPAVASGTFLKASVYSRWSSTIGGTVELIATRQEISGDIVADAYSSVALELSDTSTLTGAIDAVNSAQFIALSLDETSIWTVTGDSHIGTLSDAGGIFGSQVTNITGNGHNVFYDSTLAGNSWLGKKIYALAGGGYLTPGPIPSTGVEESVLPMSWELAQNYPNPFNPTTTIGYSVGVFGGQSHVLSGVEGSVVSSRVRLTVYDMLGREMAVLVDERKEPGGYTATWNAAGMASGVYIYRLSTNDYTLCRSMVLLK